MGRVLRGSPSLPATSALALPLLSPSTINPSPADNLSGIELGNMSPNRALGTFAAKARVKMIPALH